MSLVKLTIKGISYSQTQNGAYALILNEVDGEKTSNCYWCFAQIDCYCFRKKEIKPLDHLHDLFKNFADRFDIVVKKYYS